MIFNKSCFVTFFFVNLAASSNAEYISYDELFEDGLEAYWNENWEAAVVYFEQAIASYKQYKTGVTKCYRKCKNVTTENIMLFETTLGNIMAKASCTRQCLDEEFGDSLLIERILPEAKKLFEDLKPYAYLQLAYFKEGNLAKSVSAAHTYYLRFPDDKLMMSNMDYYAENENVTKDMYVDMEVRPHLEKYSAALHAYTSEDYSTAVELYEDALKEYYEEEETCRALCEGEDEAREDPDDRTIDFFRSTAEHYVQVLECSLKCVQDLSTNEAGKAIYDFLPVHYHYLMFAYDQLNDLNKAVECAKAFQLFHPDSKVMKKNLEIYGKEVNVDDYEAREDAVTFHKRVKLEVALLSYSYQNFGIKDFDESLLDPFPEQTEVEPEEKESLDKIETQNDSDEEEVLGEEDTQADVAEDEEAYSSMKEKTDDIIKHKDVEVERKLAEKEKRQRDEKNYEDLDDDTDISEVPSSKMGYQTIDSKYVVVVNEQASEKPLPEGPLLFPDTVLLANSSQLRGRTRFAVDGLATDDQCQSLIDMELSSGQTGDGYGGKSSPHTEHEKFEGLHLITAAKLAQQGSLPLSLVLLYYDLSEKARAQVQAYFKLPELYFEYTHLVCRTALPHSPETRTDLSHPVHADNCLLQEDGSCMKEPPAYTWRDYSAIMYLNEDFEGGEFLFTDSTAKRVRTLVKPKCGRLVAFSAGPECYHGVKPIINGQRCAVALWFTMSKPHQEKHRIEARKILDELVSKQKDEL